MAAQVLEAGGQPAQRPSNHSDAQDRQGDRHDAGQDADRGNGEKIAFE